MRKFLGAALLLTAGWANAALLDEEVPENAYITINGVDWAWAAPCAPTAPSCGVIDLSYQSQFGWRLPTAQELLNHPDAMDFVFAGANVSQGGIAASGAKFQAGAPPGDAACAAPYFSTTHYHCDWSDGLNDYWAGLGTSSSWESLVVRTSSVPLPAAVWLFLSGLGLLAWFRRKANKAKQAIMDWSLPPDCL